MSALADTERAAYKAHIASLEEQLAWFRTINMGQAAVPAAGVGPAMESGKLYDSEDEAEARELHEAGVIDAEELNEMLAAAGAMETEVEFHTP